MFRAGYNLIILFLCRGMRRGYEAQFCSPFFSNVPYISIPSFYLTYLKNYSGKYLAQKQLRDGVERYKKKMYSAFNYFIRCAKSCPIVSKNVSILMITF